MRHNPEYPQESDPNFRSGESKPRPLRSDILRSPERPSLRIERAMESRRPGDIRATHHSQKNTPPKNNGPGINTGQPPSQAPRGNYLTAFREAFRNPGVRTGYIVNVGSLPIVGGVAIFGNPTLAFAMAVGSATLLGYTIRLHHNIARDIQRQGS